MSDPTPKVSAPGGDLAELPKPTEDRRAYLRSLVELLWPGAPLRWGTATTGAASGERQYLLFPSGKRPTVMAPAAPTAGLAEVLRRYKPSAGWRTQAQLESLATAARTGVLRAWPYAAFVGAATGPTIESYLGAALGEPVAITVYTSPPRANRKPVLRILTAAGRPLGFAKLGVNPLTSALVGAEAAALRRLARADLATVVVPELLHEGRWNGIDVVVQRELAVARPQALDPVRLRAAVTELASLDMAGPAPAAGSPYLRDLRLEAGRHGGAGEPFALALDELAQAAAHHDVVLSYGSWHGDWTPWNMTSDGERAYVWDWERFSSGVPHGLDALHLRLQRAIVREGQHPRTAVEHLVAAAPSILAPYGVERNAATTTAALYLSEIGLRYVRDGQAEAGARLGDLSAWLLPGLASALEAVGR
jgi:hypothetical protein